LKELSTSMEKRGVFKKQQEPNAREIPVLKGGEKQKKGTVFCRGKKKGRG